MTDNEIKARYENINKRLDKLRRKKTSNLYDAIVNANRADELMKELDALRPAYIKIKAAELTADVKARLR